MKKRLTIIVSVSLLTLMLVTGCGGGDDENTNRKTNPSAVLISHYPFSGDASDITGNGHDGTVINATLTQDRNGMIDSAYDFDGTSYIEIPDHADLKGGTSPMSFALWFKTIDSKLVQGLLSKFNNVTRKDWGMSIWTEQRYAIGAERSGEDYVCRSNINVAESNKWIFLTYVVNPPNIKIYKDGELIVECNDFVNNWASTNANVEIGRANYAGFYFSGVIDDVKIYKGVLTKDEISSLFISSE